MHAVIAGIEYFLPDKVLTTHNLSTMFPEWSIERIDAKTGIHARHIASDDQCASDLAISAALRLFKFGICARDNIDFILLCTQSPDYALPTTACLLQERLGLPTKIGALDFNLGCSGFVYGLGLSEALITSGQAETILLMTAETYSKYLRETDKNSRTIFGDGAAATLIKSHKGNLPSFGPFVYGTDGSGANRLIVPNSGARRSDQTIENITSGTNATQKNFLHMDGNQIFDFAVKTVPKAVEDLLRKAHMNLNEIDLFIFHQANAFLLEEIRRLIGIPREKFQVTISECANTVSSTIPIALKHAQLEGKLKEGDKAMLIGFGVGYSWGATIVRWIDI